MLVAIMIGFFVLTSQSLFVQLGRYDKYLHFFWVLWLVFIIELCLMAASKAYFIVSGHCQRGLIAVVTVLCAAAVEAICEHASMIS